ncbi:hypothetical protein H5J24_07290 [Chryseobacterium capnotolerans]|uniref:hypothetical protein n=1 Tax=Chryseobacterium TaxID=59732 RepID=UPI00083B94AA|nr:MULTISPECIES: hypothetical protein [Chryseobacterium]UHO39840.1 hypothetical protein H5J24_07290 [Chryseobacterium capnotolerans]
MKKIFVLVSAVCITTNALAQQADNALQGYFEEQGNETFYKSFNFDGNGKIANGFKSSYYFTRNDSLIVIPDKDVFIFKIKKDKLIGISDWVKNGVWIRKKDSTEVNNRVNPEDARKRAILLSEYYDKTKNMSGLDALFSNANDYTKISDDFCNQGLAKACLNAFGLKMMEYTPGFFGDLEKIKDKKLKPHPELIELSKKIIDLGEPEGYNILGAYYHLLGLREKAFETWKEGEKHGDPASLMSMGLIELGEEMNKAPKSPSIKKKKKK